MKHTKMVISVIWLALAFALFTGCSVSSNDREAKIEFDGETVEYDGPDAIQPGEMKISLENTSPYDLDILVVKMEPGKTWLDMLDYLGPPGSKVPPPEWVENTTSSGVPNEPYATLFILEEGSYSIILCRCNEILDYQVWPVSYLEVEGE